MLWPARGSPQAAVEEELGATAWFTEWERPQVAGRAPPNPCDHLGPDSSGRRDPASGWSGAGSG